MVNVRNIVDSNNASDFINKKAINSNEKIWIQTVSVNDIKNFSKTLKSEIIYTRENYDTDNPKAFTTNEIWRRDLYDIRKTFSDNEKLEALSQELYYID